LAVAVEGGVFCTLQTKHCHRIRYLSHTATAALAAVLPAMVAPAPLAAWSQMAGRLVMAIVVLAGQAAPGTLVGLHLLRVEAAVALENRGQVVTAAQAFNQTYPVPPVIMAAAAAAPPGTTSKILAKEDWVAEDWEGIQFLIMRRITLMVIQVLPSQGAEVVAVDIIVMEVQAAPAWSSSATKMPPATTKAAPRTTTTTARAASRARPARRGCPTRTTNAYARRTTTARLTAACTHAPRVRRVPHDPLEIPSRVALRRCATQPIRRRAMQVNL
jgi:hypothetical protein